MKPAGQVSIDPEQHARRAAVRKESIISAVMNVVIGLGFFLIVFGWHRASSTSVALDFLPQTMGMTFLGGMVSSLICLSRIAKNTLIPAGPVPSRKQQTIRVFGLALGAMALFGGTMALLVALLAPPELDPAPILALKSIYGILMAFITTPPVVRMALGMSLRGGVRRPAPALAKG